VRIDASAGPVTEQRLRPISGEFGERARGGIIRREIGYFGMVAPQLGALT